MSAYSNDIDPDIERASNYYTVKESFNTIPSDMPAADDDAEIFEAIAASLKESKTPYTSFESTNPFERQRVDGLPVGLKNIGNTCYFNSLMQAYFMIPKLIQEILTFKPHPSHLKQKTVEGVDVIRKKASIKLVEEMQRLFAYMIRSNKKYADPSNVLNALVDDFGNRVEIGDQKDVGEFNMIFVARLEEGLKTKNPEESKENGEKTPTDFRVFLRKEWLNLSRNQLLEASIVSNLFYGNLIEMLQSVEADGTESIAKKGSMFGQILLDVDEGDLYSSWDSAYHAQIEGYKTPLGHTCTANQETWLEKIPSLLLFQIQRVKYDTTTWELYKVNKPFTFPNLLYPDRFLLQNKELGTKLRQRYLEIKKKIKLLEISLEKFRNYKAKGIDFSFMLQKLTNFFEDQEKVQEVPLVTKNEGITTYFTEKIVQEHDKDSAMARAKELIKKITEDVDEKVKIMEDQLIHLKIESDQLFDIPELKQNLYNLHSIMIHSGQAQGGHYYAYVFDAEYEIWRRYSDIYVTQVSEEDVWKDAIGGSGYSSAYCLMYIRTSLIPKIPKGLLRSYTLTGPVEQVTDHYKSLLSPELKAEVDKDNSRFDVEIEEFRVSEILRSIKDQYTKCQNSAWTQKYSYKNYSSTKKETVRSELTNLAVHLKIKGEELLSRWNILDNCIRDQDPFQRGLEQLEHEDPVFELMSMRFKHICREAPYTYILTEGEKRKLESEARIFYDNFYYAWLSVYIIESILDSRYMESLRAFTYYFSLVQEYETEYQKLPSELYRMFLLYLTSMINEKLYKKEVYEAAEWVGHLAYFTTSYMSIDEPHYEQISQRVMASHKWLKENLPSYYNADIHKSFSEAIEDFASDTPHTKINWNKPSEELEKLIDKLNSFNRYSWVEGWTNDGIAYKYIATRKVLSMSSLNTWVNLSERLLSANEIVSEQEMREIEYQVGIFPKEH